MKLKLLLTFDYELPMGGTQDFQKALFLPTERILEVANRKKVPVNLFADICSYTKFLKINKREYCDRFKKQLQDAINRGHDVQLHPHPNWFKTEIKNNTYTYNSHFSLIDFKNEKINTEDIIKRSVSELTRICQMVDINYRCVAFRAAGADLAGRDFVFGILHKYGIRIDSSISKGNYFKTTLFNIDYRTMPQESNWEIHRGIMEIPIANKSKNPLTNFPTRFKKKIFSNRKYDCAGKGGYLGEQKFVDMVKASFSPRMLGFDLHTMSVDDLINIVKHNCDKYHNDDTVYLCTVSHPKAMGDYHIKLMEDFISIIRKDFKNIEFTTYREAYKELVQNKTII